MPELPQDAVDMPEMKENANSKAKGSAAKWRDKMKILQAAFPSPWRETGKDQIFENTFLSAVALLNQMKHSRVYRDEKAWQGYLGDPALPDYRDCKDAELNEESMPLDQVIEELVRLFNGMPNWNHPQIMANVVPPANTAAIVGSSLCQIFNPNILEGEYSWNVARTEIESAAMAAQLIGWDPRTSGGIFTFGGTGCYLYGLKLALTTVLGKESRSKGIREDGQVLVSREGHFIKQNCTDWTGLGMDNVREIQVDEDNCIDVSHLQSVMEACRRENKPVVMIVCTMGTTDAFAIDPIEDIRRVIDQYENAGGAPRPLLYADAVIGWSWLAFRSYDFKKNALQFSKTALRILERNFKKMEPLFHADAIGIDFHKTGWAPYSCSLFMIRDYDRFAELMSRPSPAYLQDRTPYNPFKYTLETSRSGAYAMAGWATLRLFGRQGFQVMLGRIIEVGLFLRQLLDRDKNLVCVNPDNHGFVTLYRVYPKHVDAAKQYERELNDPEAREELRAYNLLQQRVANKLFAMLRDPEQKIEGWENPPYTSFTSGYRPPAYAPDEKDSRYFVYALKSFPMSPNSNELSMLIVRNYVLKARDLVIEEILSESAAQEKDRLKKGKNETATDQRKAENWYGENADIPAEFLISSVESSVVDILKRIPVCGHLSEDQLERLGGTGRHETVDAGTVLFSEGDKADKVYLILEGKVKIFKQEAAGQERELATFDKGSFFGEMALFESGLRSAAVKALETCEFYIIDGNVFLEQVLG